MLTAYNHMRRGAKEVKIGRLAIGGKNPIAVQSMTNTDTLDRAATYAQVKALEDAGCDIVRITAPNTESVQTFAYLKDMGIKVPLVADIHFDYRIALECAAVGVDKIRINPGNIGDESRVKRVVEACNAKNIPIRIGVNGGSLEKIFLQSTALPLPKHLPKARCITRLCLKNLILTI